MSCVGFNKYRQTKSVENWGLKKNPANSKSSNAIFKIMQCSIFLTPALPLNIFQTANSWCWKLVYCGPGLVFFPNTKGPGEQAFKRLRPSNECKNNYVADGRQVFLLLSCTSIGPQIARDLPIDNAFKRKLRAWCWVRGDGNHLLPTRKRRLNNLGNAI